MASSYFTINPASGYGNGTVGVTASTENTSQADRYASVSVTNGVEVVPVTVKQLYKPYFIQTGHDLPASGGTISILVHTEYDVVFRGIPSYATMRLNGQTISNDQIIASGTASGATFVLEIPENTSTTPRSVSFYLAHYLNGTRTVTGYISFYQDGAVVPADYNISLSPSVGSFDYLAGETGTTTVGLTGFTYATVSKNGNDFSVNPTGSVGSGTVLAIQTLTQNNTQADRTVTITAGQTNPDTQAYVSATYTGTQKYKPYFVQSSQIIPSSGGTITFTAHTEYTVFFNNIPNWITVTLNGSPVSAGNAIPASVADGATFVITAAANETGQERSTSNFTMGCSLEQIVQYFSITQQSGEEPVHATSITINVPSVIYDSGNTSIETGPPDADVDIDYTSSDPSIATIDENGIITVVDDGTVTICAYDNISGLQDCKTVEVHTGAQPDYRSKYLTFEVTSPGNIEWYSSGDEYITIEYRKNNGNWTSVTSSRPGATVTSVVAGDIVEFRGDNPTYRVGGYPSTFYGTSCGFIVYGNIMSLIDSTNFRTLTTLSSESTFVNLFNYCRKLTDASNLVLPATTLANWCYQGMFYNCTGLTAAPSLPATTLVQGCYSNMFDGCTSLTTAPQLPATTLAGGCYSSMFRGCTRLTRTPSLPVTTLAESCYYFMFSGCTSLTTATSLPATTLASRCYEGMFYGCTRLNYIKCLATGYVTNSTNNWVYGVASSGTFVKNPSMTGWTTGVSGIPNNWTVVDAT